MVGQGHEEGSHGHWASLSCKQTIQDLSEARGHFRLAFSGNHFGWSEGCALVRPVKRSRKGIPGEGLA